ncbi:MAG: lysylphosphatidylglycerol synthase domain-containing protein [Bacteroidota bacterium]
MYLKKLYKSISLFLKLLITALSLWYIYSKVFRQNDPASLFSNMNPSRSYLLGLVLVLMPLNWSLEALKWRMLVARLEPLSFFRALQGVWCGLSVSIFTPNRVGEFSGRIFLLEKADRIRAALLTFAGNAAQVFVTLGMAALSFVLWRLFGLELPAHDESAYYYSQGVLNGVSLTGLLSFIFALSLAALVLLFRGRITNRHALVIRSISAPEWRKLIWLSLARYMVFLLQFYLLLRLFDVDVRFGAALILIPLVFFLITVIPTFALTEIGVRGSAALFLFSLVSDNESGILAASLLLWMINLALPALAGLFLIFRLKFFRGE